MESPWSQRGVKQTEAKASFAAGQAMPRRAPGSPTLPPRADDRPSSRSDRFLWPASTLHRDDRQEFRQFPTTPEDKNMEVGIETTNTRPPVAKKKRTRKERTLLRARR